MSELANHLDRFFNRILLLAEHQHELLLGHCQSDLNLTNTQEHILMLLADERLSNSDLAKRLNISQAAVTKAVKSMIQRDLLVTLKDETDARVSYYSLTETAQAVAKEHNDHHLATLTVYDRILERFSDNEQETLSKFLDALEEEFEQS